MWKPCKYFLPGWSNYFAFVVWNLKSPLELERADLPAASFGFLLSPWSFCCWDSLTAQILHSRKFFKKMQTFRSRRGDPLKAAAAAVGEQQATNPFYIKATAVRRTTLEAWSRHTSETSHYAKAYLTIQKGRSKPTIFSYLATKWRESIRLILNYYPKFFLKGL